ncbi:hypothetical protein PRK78_004411 [Emydomyces testavorans]|uniref:SP-RING-type domain-containing protein n=1 Tax=Emydomyces testavorans TaxID=2070801 RepID=A0AAF0DIR8_9EURO|nr:hypothetical protein PRK78_004411 [Emydomyces testavorans]
MPGQSARRTSRINRRPSVRLTGIDATGISLSLANATASRFLGGHQKSWMQGLSVAEQGHTSQRSVDPASTKPPTGSGAECAEKTNANFTHLLSPQSPPNEETLLQPPPTEPQLAPMSRGQVAQHPQSTVPSRSPSVVNLQTPESSGLPTPGDFNTAPSPAPHDEFETAGASQHATSHSISAAEQPPNCLPLTTEMQSSTQDPAAHGHKRMRTGETTWLDTTTPSQTGRSPRSKQAEIENQLCNNVRTPTDRLGFPVRIDPTFPSLKHVAQDISRNLEFLKSQATSAGCVRVKVLQSVCNAEDFFFLALHQTLCVNAINPKLLMAVPGFGFDQISGLSVIRDALLSRYSVTFLRLCSEFPAEFTGLVRNNQAYMQSMKAVTFCLPLLARGWPVLVNIIRQRQYPPLIDELVCRFIVPSCMVQRALFHRFCELLYGGRSVELLRKLHEIHLLDRNYYDARLAKTQSGHLIPPAQVHHEHQHVIQEYKNACLLFGNSTGLRIAASALPTPIATTTPVTPTVDFQNVTAPTQHQAPSTSQLPPQSTLPNQPHVSQQAPGPDPQTQETQRSQSRPTTLHQNIAQVHYAHNGVSQQTPQLQRPQPRVAIQSGSVSQNHFQYAPNGTYLQNFGATAQQPPQYQPHATIQHVSHCQNTPGGISQRSVSAVIQPTQQAQLYTRIQYGNITQHSYGPNNTPPQFVLPSNFPRPTVTDMRLPVQTQQRSQAPRLSTSFAHNPPAPGTPLLPRAGVMTPEIANPNPYVIGLHQMHLRVGARELTDTNNNDLSKRLLIYLDSFAVQPFCLGPQEVNFSCHLVLSSEAFQKLPVRLPSSQHGYSQQGFTSGTQMYQLRCVRWNSAKEDLTDEVWATLDCVWPNAIYIHVNNTEHLVRRKFHNGRDLPLNVSESLKQGDNAINVTVLRNPGESTKVVYYVAVEILESMERGRVRDSIEVLSKPASLGRIIERLGNPAVDDDEIAIVDDYIAIDLIDPFMARIFDTPVRGKFCLHWECFDLETFLNTRMVPHSNGHTMAESWKCPICRQDARPKSLVIDEFLLDIRVQLAQQNQLDDVKAIMVKKDGSWAPKIEQNTTTDQQVITSRKGDTDMDKNGTKNSPTWITPKRCAPEVIELD